MHIPLSAVTSPYRTIPFIDKESYTQYFISTTSITELHIGAVWDDWVALMGGHCSLYNCTTENLHSGGNKYIVAPFICHPQKRAPAICEITLFVWDGCTFCPFRSDNDLDYMPPSLPASFWHLQLFRREHLHTLPSTFNSAPAKNPNSLCPILIKRIHLSWKSSHLFGCESSRLFSVIHVVIYLSRCRSFDLHLTSVLTWMLLSASVFCGKSQILLYASHSWFVYLTRDSLGLKKYRCAITKITTIPHSCIPFWW